LAFLLISAVGASAADVEISTAKELQGIAGSLSAKQGFASKELKRYGNHYTMVAHREQTGSAEVHEQEADFFVVESGRGTLVTGGKVVNPKTEKAGEIRGTSIEGGDRHPVAAGDIVHIPAGVPHQLLLDNGTTFNYFVIKVTGQ
jgi:mannose-6-phosphate isomerase-like protein (cupin superfamily)